MIDNERKWFYNTIIKSEQIKIIQKQSKEGKYYDLHHNI